MSKYYVVKKGYNPGIYNNWIDCEKQVKGFSGAVFKSFKTPKDADNYLHESSSPTITLPSQNLINSTISINDHIVVYTDGSSKNYIGGYCYAIIPEELLNIYSDICYLKDKETYIENNMIKNYGPTPGVSTNNFAELYAIQKCLSNEKGNIKFYTDSNYSIKALTEWSKNWIKNGWKTTQGNNVENKDIIQNILHLMKNRNITFQHVFGHNGNIYNEIVDKYANIGRELSSPN